MLPRNRFGPLIDADKAEKCKLGYGIEIPMQILDSITN